MSLEELKRVVDDLVERGYGDTNVILLDEEIEPWLDIFDAYYDEDRDRVVLYGLSA